MTRPDPRGPLRIVTETTPGNCDGNDILFDCGHSETFAPHFPMPRIGSSAHCYDCGRIALAAWNESERRAT